MLRGYSARCLNVLACLALLSVVACSDPDPSASGDMGISISGGWALTEGIQTPESVYVDAASGFIFSSQVVGAPNERDGNGRIVKLRADGTVDDPEWVSGLNAPKGMRSHDGMLWVSDLDEVVGIDIATGEVRSRVRIDGAQFLNDVAVGPDGTVYVSDMMASRIYAVRDGAYSVFAEGERLEWPNGILVEGNRLIVGGWGQPGPDFSTEVPGRLYALDLTSGEKTLITPEPFANIDGVESDGRGGYVLTDWIAGKVYQVDAGGSVRELLQLTQGTADHAFVAQRNLLIVPHMLENRLEAYDLSDAF